MLLDALLLLLGLALLLGGGEMVVRGGTGLARALGVSPLAIGLTIVAFGTSAPELAVNITAALRGRGDICFGNIIGSNMANIGLIVSLTALLRPIHIRGVVVQREIPMMLLATGAALAMGLDTWTGNGPSRFDRGDAIILLLLFVLFLYYTIGEFVGRYRDQTRIVETGGEDSSLTRRALFVTAIGLTGLVAGAEVSVDAAVALARAFGVSEVVIGISVLAVGTSLPELVASLVASVRGHVELAVGNVVGSNIFNLLLVGGFTSLIAPIPVPAGGVVDMLMMALLSVALLVVSLTWQRNIVRTEAALLLLLYGAYLSWRVAPGLL